VAHSRGLPEETAAWLGFQALSPACPAVVVGMEVGSGNVTDEHQARGSKPGNDRSTPPEGAAQEAEVRLHPLWSSIATAAAAAAATGLSHAWRGAV
jgi:hypothetical protein